MGNIIHKIHKLKTWPEPFQEIFEGRKTAEFRLNDRGFSLGDILHLEEWSPKTREYTGRNVDRKVTNLILGGQFGIPENYCVMSVSPLTPTNHQGPNFFAKLVGKHVRVEIQNENPTPGTIVGFSRYEVLFQEDDTSGPILVMKHSIKCIIPDGNPFEKKEVATDAKEKTG